MSSPSTGGMMIDIWKGIMGDNRPPFSCYDSILPDLYGQKYKTKVRKFCKDKSASSSSKIVHTPPAKTISWLKSCSLVVFGLTSDGNLYSSSICMWVTESEVLGNRGHQQWLFHCLAAEGLLIQLQINGKWDREEKWRQKFLQRRFMTLAKHSCLIAPWDNSWWRCLSQLFIVSARKKKQGKVLKYMTCG